MGQYPTRCERVKYETTRPQDYRTTGFAVRGPVVLWSCSLRKEPSVSARSLKPPERKPEPRRRDFSNPTLRFSCKIQPRASLRCITRALCPSENHVPRNASTKRAANMTQLPVLCSQGNRQSAVGESPDNRNSRPQDNSGKPSANPLRSAAVSAGPAAAASRCGWSCGRHAALRSGFAEGLPILPGLA